LQSRTLNEPLPMYFIDMELGRHSLDDDIKNIDRRSRTL
jgi:hypothetical protein